MADEQPIYHFVRTRGREHHTGIPARDLHAADLEALTDEQKATVEASPVYRRIETREAAAVRTATGMTDEDAPAPVAADNTATDSTPARRRQGGGA